MSEIKIKINGKEFTGNKGETIYELCSRNGIEIPTLCHDPRLEPYSSCYVCVVEIEGARGLQPSCSTKINDGMVIHTENGRVKTSRKMALDLLLSNHYADCMGPCKQTCPAGVDVQGYISLIDKGMYSEAVGLIKEVNPLPAICGRVCVRPCEDACRRNLLDEGAPVGIDYLKRFAADTDLQKAQEHFKPEVAPSTGKKVAVIGGGPGGLSAAYFLQQKGHQVDIFDGNPKPGGMLRYGIPEYRLPNDLLDKEISRITDLGANLYSGRKLGKDLSYKEIKDKYDATVLTIGSQRGTLVGCEGDDAKNVFSGIDFLRNMEMTGQKLDFTGKKVAVVGGGNTAMDCCRTAMRCGAEKVYVIYRRTEKEMPANPIEIHESKLEGIEYMLLTNPAKINKDEEGCLKTMTCIKMQLGEPDKSGRRRPIPIEGSEFDIELDYVLAAIGQKTDVNFIDDINAHATDGQLVVNRWGDIDADKKTLQTGIKSVFAAGDGVTGPATLIEAIAQAKIASRSCHQFLTGQEFKAPEAEFLSKRENFKDQEKEEYINKFEKQIREEMPTLDPDKRVNFDEVELGYKGEEIAKHETQRCLECGCVEYYDCDLKKYSTKYCVEQQKFGGDYAQHEVDFSHPFIEIDNNKCILCSRCIRICNEVVGANALGLVQRGFETFVAPSLGNSLVESPCESCGMCIETCPTGAISENVPFKPGPLKLDSFQTISNFGSTGEAINIHHKNGYVMKVTGAKGLVNREGNLSRTDKFGYHYFNDSSRITKPMLKVDGEFKEISFDEAFNLIKEKIKNVKADENAFFAGARLTNEEQYLVQKLARAAVKTNNVTSFHYLGRGEGYRYNCEANVPFDQIDRAGKIWLFGAELNEDHPMVGFMVNNAKVIKNVPVELVTIYQESTMEAKVDKIHRIESYYYFIKAVNYYLVKNNLQNQLYINDCCAGFEEYKKTLLADDFNNLIDEAGVAVDAVKAFAEEYNKQMNAVIVFSEKEISATESVELFNLAMITGKLGKIATGLIALKEKNNSQGLFDMGCTPAFGIGSQKITDENFVNVLKEKWNIDSVPQTINMDYMRMFDRGEIKNLLVFGEDPIGCAIVEEEVNEIFNGVDFMVVQDYFMTETAKNANLILPASLPVETGGSFTNTQKVIQQFEAGFKPKAELTNHEQLIKLLGMFGFNGLSGLQDVTMEAIALLPEKHSCHKFAFESTDDDDFNRMFDFGCDVLMKNFDEYFDNSFEM